MIDRDILDSLFSKQKNTTVFGNITERLPSGRFVVTTESGHKYTAIGDDTWTVGTGVAVQGGVITSLATFSSEIKTHYV